MKTLVRAFLDSAVKIKAVSYSLTGKKPTLSSQFDKGYWLGWSHALESCANRIRKEIKTRRKPCKATARNKRKGASR